MTYSLATLALVVAFNYLNELLTALRQVRAVSWMQFVNSLVFTIAGLALVICWESTAEAIVLAYAISCLAAMIAIAPWFRELVAEFRADARRLPHSDLWTRLLPFAGWIWVTNLLVNLAEFADRLLIIHVSGLTSHAAQSLVGQYHSSRVVPFLLATLGMTIAGIMLPHLSQAWEADRKREVSDRTILAIKLVSLVFTAGGLTVLWASPLLFDVILAGKYSDGLHAMPWALVGCIWFSQFVIAQNYVLCAERVRLGTLAIGIGLLLNVALSYVAVPHGLTAIMAARAGATLAPLALMLWFNRRHGMPLGRGLMLSCALPLTIVLGAVLGTVLLIALVVLDWRTHCLFDEREQPQVRGVLNKIAVKLKLV
jgi:O-antigen/teichoic acid export membrane protein